MGIEKGEDGYGVLILLPGSSKNYLLTPTLKMDFDEDLRLQPKAYLIDFYKKWTCYLL